jgi:beta-glucosidase
MTLAEKIGQMTQVERGSITPQAVAELGIGSILNGGGGGPEENKPRVWLEMVNSFLAAAPQMRLPIPVIYGVDAVHGHGNVRGATMFPHNSALGATRDADLLRRIGRATAVEVAATGIRWDFAPAVSVAKDIRWGRAFESYSENVAVVSELGRAYIEGLQGDDLTQPTSVMPSVKHFVADGGTAWMTPEPKYDWIPGMWEQKDGHFSVDQGVAEIDEETLRREHLPPYIAAIEAGALNIMVSYSSWGGMKMHAQKYLLTDVLKGELGFEGFLVSDWIAVDQLERDYYSGVVRSINAGLDMIMVPYRYQLFIDCLTRAVENGDVSMSRIDDAVGRILHAKEAMGLFDSPLQDDSLLPQIGCDVHRQLAREAVQKSAVLLKNDNDLLPLAKTTKSILVAGQAALDIGLCCGGWTINWAGGEGEITPGSTILQGIRDLVSAETSLVYTPNGTFNRSEQVDVGIVVLNEYLYVEGYGDRPDLSLPDSDVALLKRVAAQCDKVVVILIAGRPLIITDHLDKADAWVMAWLPGSESNGVADVLFGDVPFTGRLPFTWPRTSADLPQAGKDGSAVLFPFGHGL